MCKQMIQGYRKTSEGNVFYETVCGKCTECRWSKVDDWVGRSLLEASHCAWTIPVTLTYRDQEDGSHKHINKRHFQAAIRSLRKRGHKVRYLASGEYGDLKARAHFHAILFGADGDPPVNHIRQREWVDWWPHGHIFADDHQATPKSIRYVAKYLLKEHGKQWFTVSKKPPIGDIGLRHIAERAAQADVLPSLRYMPEGGHPKGRYVLRRKSAENLHQYLHEAFSRYDRDIDAAYFRCAHQSTVELFDKLAGRENEKAKEQTAIEETAARRYFEANKVWCRFRKRHVLPPGKIRGDKDDPEPVQPGVHQTGH